MLSVSCGRSSSAGHRKDRDCIDAPAFLLMRMWYSYMDAWTYGYAYAVAWMLECRDMHMGSVRPAKILNPAELHAPLKEPQASMSPACMRLLQNSHGATQALPARVPFRTPMHPHRRLTGSSPDSGGGGKGCGGDGGRGSHPPPPPPPPSLSIAWA